MRVLNLYAGIGGNRKFWDKEHTGLDLDITAVELDPKITKIYQDFFPNDKVIVTDAHPYLLEHFKEFDFIWSSPPCPSHSRFNNLNVAQGFPPRYPDMALWQEIILLKHWFKGKFCVENVITYYEPMFNPIESNNHFFWTNFWFTPFRNTTRGIRRVGKNDKNFGLRKERTGFDLSKHNLETRFEKQVLNNCVEPELGLHILKESQRNIQPELFNPQGARG